MADQKSVADAHSASAPDDSQIESAVSDVEAPALEREDQPKTPESDTSKASSTRRRRKRRRKANKNAAELRLQGRRSLCKGIADISEHMLKTTKLRVLGNYLESSKGLSEDDLTARLKKDATKIAAKDRILRLLREVDPDINRRNLQGIILFHILLQEENHELVEGRLEQKVLDFEKEIVRRAKDVDFFDRKAHDPVRWHQYETYRVALKAAWENEDDVSSDEAILLRVLRRHLNISLIEHWIIGATLKRFPKPKRVLHTREEIHDARKHLQRQSLLWSYRDQSNQNIDIVPAEVVNVLRGEIGLELQRTNYRRLLEHDQLTVAEFRDILKDRDMDAHGTKAELIERLAHADMRPSEFLEQLDRPKLASMCRHVGMPGSGNKPNLVQRLIDFYDDLTFEERETQDPREDWYNNYELLAARRYSDLRAKKLISKDLEVEHLFEKATDFLFEEKLRVPIDNKRKVTKADGRIPLENEEVILWDCKSVEKAVNLQDHLEGQFDRYLRKELEKGSRPLAFLVIAPAFTPESAKAAHQYKARTNWDIAMITAEALKHLAELWDTSEGDKRFPIRLLNKTEIIDKEKAEFLVSLA